MGDNVIVIVIPWLICGLVAAWVAKSKGEVVSVFFVVFLLGPIGVVLAFLRSGEAKHNNR